MDINQINNEINVVDALNLYTEVKHNVIRDECVCPKCRNRGIKPLRLTLKINKYLNEWYCYKCKTGGSVIDVFTKLMGQDQELAIANAKMLLNKKSFNNDSSNKNNINTLQIHEDTNSTNHHDNVVKPKLPRILDKKSKILGSIA